MKTYTPTVGMEIHAELKTETKMFCSSRNAPHESEPNAHVCPVCLAHPGTLPVINAEAVRQVIMVGVALGGEIATFTEFDRKNYFYPDIPKGYQISQYKYPLVQKGELAGVAITRVHLEEDTARSLHDQGEGSIVDYNRAGVPLMELVTEPVIHDSETAGAFARELQLLLRTLGVSDANMEKGEMRVEANISISDSDKLGTKVEVKNLNSIRAMEAAIEYEVRRQKEVLEKGESVIQETRGWDEHKLCTYIQRTKETAEDYRYFPDPDLPKLDTTLSEEFSLSRIRENMPVLPSEKRLKYENLGLSRESIEVIVGDIELSGFFERIVPRVDDPKLLSNYLVSDLAAIRTEHDIRLDNVDGEAFSALMNLLSSGAIGSRVAKDLLPEVVLEGIDPKKAAEERGLLQMSSDAELLDLVREIISSNQKAVDEYKAGKEASLQFLVGQGMKMTKGSANPEKLKSLLESELS